MVCCKTLLYLVTFHSHCMIAEFQKVNAEAYEASQYSATAMNAFPQLTDKNIDDILFYKVKIDENNDIILLFFV